MDVGITPSNAMEGEDIDIAEDEFVNVLPHDCLNHMLSFLELQESLAFGSSSITALDSISVDLKRRQRRLVQKFAYQDVADTKTSPPFRLLGPLDGNGKSAATAPADAYVLPTVCERVESLSRAIPLSHPLAASVRDLRHHLLAIDSEDSDQLVDSNSSNKTLFETRFYTMKRLLRAHRIHAHILRRAIESEPAHWERGYSGSRSHYSHTSHGPREVLTVTLERYMGDVMCAFYLMGHTAAGIVEGGPTEHEWMQKIKSDLSSTSVSAVGSYQSWIFLHSTLLRTAPFTREQQRMLHIAAPLYHPGDSYEGLLQPHSPFKGCDKLEFLAAFESPEGARRPLRVTFNEFGRLGPTFRGRDLIESHDMLPGAVVDRSTTFLHLRVPQYDRSDELPPFVLRWIAGEDTVIAWLFEMHTESNKTRPMTVAPPLVTIRAS